MWSASWAAIESEGKQFRSSLNTGDVLRFRVARVLFYLTVFVPYLLYYVGGSGGLGEETDDLFESPPKFPATISYVTRKGAPAIAQRAIWLVGWSLCGYTYWRRGSARVRAFAAAMFATGVWTTMLVPLGAGAGRVADGNVWAALHHAGATLYMIEHEVLFSMLAITPVLRRAFRRGFAVMLAGLVVGNQLELGCGVDNEESGVHSGVRAAQLAACTPASLRASILAADFAAMAGEVALFVSFVHGLPSGLRR